MKQLVSQILSATVGLWLASLFVVGIIVKIHSDSNLYGLAIHTPWQFFLLWGITLGLLNYFGVKLLLALDIPLGFISFHILSLLLGYLFLWAIDYCFAEIYIPLYLPLAYTGLIIWALNIVIKKILIHD